MKKFLALLLSLLALTAPPALALDTVFTWVDREGVTHVESSPPPAGVSAKAIGTPSPGAQAVAVELPAAGGRPSAPGGFVPVEKPAKAVAVAGSGVTDRSPAADTLPQVELYSTSWCPWCKKAAEFFRSRQIPFTEYDIEKDPAAAKRKRELDEQGGVPFAIVNGRRIHGYAPAEYERALQKN